MWAKASTILAFLFLAAVAGGCSAPMQSGNWFLAAEAAPSRRAPTARITQSDVVALEEAVAALARSENPRRYEEASRRLAELLPRFEGAGEDSLAAQTLFWLAYCYENTGRKEDAAAFYDQILHKYPQTFAAEQAKARRARMEFKRPAE